MVGLTDDTDVLDTLPFERRAADRAPASGSMQAVLANGREMPWVMRLGLLDASQSGLCVKTDAPIEPGARLSLRVDPVHGNWTTGVVVRCVKDGGDFRVGISYERRRAA